MTTPYIYEFLYRGVSPNDAGAEPAWHLIIAADSTDGFGTRQQATRTLNMQQALAEGWALPTIIETINAQALAQVEQARTIIQGMLSEEQAPADPVPTDDNPTPAPTFWQQAQALLAALLGA